MVVELKWGEASELARQTGKDVGHIWRVCSGERRPSRELAEKIAAFTGEPVEELFPDLPPTAEQDAGGAAGEQAG